MSKMIKSFRSHAKAQRRKESRVKISNFASLAALREQISKMI